LKKIFKEGTVPKCFKSGIITPVYKKQDKPINNPNLFQCRKVYVTLIPAIQHQKPLKRQ
jgi:hypothetical protein